MQTQPVRQALGLRSFNPGHNHPLPKGGEINDRGVAPYIPNGLAIINKSHKKIALAAPRGSLGVDIPLHCTHGQMLWELHRAASEIKKIQAPCLYIGEAAALRTVLMFAWDWLKKQRVRLILHGSEILVLARSRKFRELLLRAEKIYTLSRAVAQLVLDVEPSVAGKIIITGAAPSPALTPLPVPRAEKQLLTVARLHPRKGQHIILESMAAGQLPGFTYDMVGAARNGRYTRKLKSLVAAKKLPARFHGEVDDARLSLLYSQSSLFVLPATTLDQRLLSKRIEGYGLVLLDAQAMGLPVIATDCGGISEAVQHCRTGLIVPPIVGDDRTAFVEAILQLTQDTHAWDEMSRAARAWANKMSWEKVAEKLFA